MYFPYLRGRQYELLAIRELLGNNLLGTEVFPIIEPVKASSTLILSMNAFSKAKRKLGIILNPEVGSLEKDLNNTKNVSIKANWEQALNSEYITKFYHMTQGASQYLKKMQTSGTDLSTLGVVCATTDGIRLLEENFTSVKPLFSLIPDESIFRRRVRDNRVMFADRFVKQARNTDYAEKVDEDFSSDHLFYDVDGYTGFSDYSVIGQDYSETGFAPYAVAIHIVYFDLQGNLRIHHFVSDTNDDITDPAGKFEEAAQKLMVWNSEKQLDTLGIRELSAAYQNKKYPGLGTVKKYTIMHHLELMGNYLNEVKAQ